MSADKVQEARHKFFGALYSDLMTGEHTADAKLDALIAAVREDEREQAVARVLVPSNRYTFHGNRMSGYDEGEYLRTAQTVEAIRNA